jgi:predicted Zn-dependent peptidase
VNRTLSIASLLVLAGCPGSGGSVTHPAPFDPAGDKDPIATPTDPKPTDPTTKPMTQTAQPQDLTFPDEAFRAEQPKPGTPRPFNLPAMKPFTLKNGIKVYLVEQHALPIVSADLTFEGGSVVDPEGKDGLASVCMAMLTEGTQRLDKIAYSEALADVASSIDSYAGGDSQGVSMSSLSAHFDTTFALFVETLRTPGFRTTDFDRLIKRRIESIKQSKATPAGAYGRVSGAVLYGPDHPYGAVTTEASLGKITIDDCKAHHAKWIKPRGAKLFVVGDLTEAQIRQHFDGEKVAGWTGTMPKPPAMAAPKTMKGKIFLVDIPGAQQSRLGILHFGPKRNAPDFFPTTVLGSLLGGSFTSRINMNLREDKGYAYGASGSFGYSRQYGTFSAGASVRTDATYQSLIELDREIRELQSNKTPPKADELDREKTGAILGLPGRFATASATLGQFRGLVYFGLPLDYYNGYIAKIGKVTGAQVTAAAKKHLKPGQAVIVVVGDASAAMKKREGGADVPLLDDGKPVTLRESLADLLASGAFGKGGTLVVLDADGKPVP